MKKLMLFAAVLMLTQTLVAQDAIRINYTGTAPSVKDFVSALLSQTEEDESLNGLNDAWHRYKKGVKQLAGRELTVDAPNGFVGYEDTDNYGNDTWRQVIEVCYWNYADKKHKLVAISIDSYRNGHPEAGQYDGVTFYRFDNATRKMHLVYEEELGLTIEPPANTRGISHELPRHGKTIVYNYYTPSGKIAKRLTWNGSRFDFIEQTLPNTAVQKDENAEVILYTNLDIAPTEDSNSQTSVWLKYKDSGKVHFLFNTNNDTKPRWEDMKDGNGITVSAENIAAGDCSNCRLISWDSNKIFVEGCPDSRNVWSYIYDIRNQKAIQLPSTEGLLTIDEVGHLFNMSLYRYRPEGGRYSVKRSYTIDGKYTGKEQMLEENE